MNTLFGHGSLFSVPASYTFFLSRISNQGKNDGVMWPMVEWMIKLLAFSIPCQL